MEGVREETGTGSRDLLEIMTETIETIEALIEPQTLIETETMIEPATLT